MYYKIDQFIVFAAIVKSTAKERWKTVLDWLNIIEFYCHENNQFTQIDYYLLLHGAASYQF